jgi:hypothetical protein
LRDFLTVGLAANPALEIDKFQKGHAGKDAGGPGVQPKREAFEILLFKQSASADKPTVATDFNPWRAGDFNPRRLERQPGQRNDVQHFLAASLVT